MTTKAAPSDTDSFAVRHTSAEELVEMVRSTHTAQRMVLGDIPERRRGVWPSENLLPRKRVLTSREREVLKLLAEGRTVRSAADVLGLSMKTVDAHKFNLMRKLGDPQQGRVSDVGDPKESCKVAGELLDG